MRVAIIGASPVGVAVAEALIGDGHNVILIDRNREKLDQLAQKLDCGLIHGDGGTPGVLRDIGPDDKTALVCVTNHDEVNILASLVGRSLGFGRSITKIEDEEFEPVCRELGLQDLLVPDRSAVRALVDMLAGEKAQDYQSYFKNEARLFSHVVREDQEGALDTIKLPAKTAVICVYREREFFLPQPDFALKAHDEILFISDDRNIDNLPELLGPRPEQG